MDTERPGDIPILESSIGSTALRRKLASIGCKTVADAFRLSDDELDQHLTWQEADEVIRCRERQGSGKTQKLARPQVPCPPPTLTPSSLSTSSIRTSGHGTPALIQHPYEPVPSSDEFHRLLKIEASSKAVFIDLGDRYATVMAYQAFDYLDQDLDTLARDFISLFQRFRNQPQRLLALIDQNLRNAFVVFISFEARELFDGDSFWESLLELLGMSKTNAWTPFKRLYIDQLKRLRMPAYQRDERAYYYFYTALLHGGLSKSSWADLWKKTLLPTGRQAISRGVRSPGPEEALSLLNNLKHSIGSQLPGRATLSILEKMPEDALLPLLESSLSAAYQYEQTRRFPSNGQTSENVLLASNGLPTIAIRGLQKALSPAQRRPRNAAHEGCEPIPVFIPRAEAFLSLDSTTIRFSWKQVDVPDTLKNCRFDYFASGRLAASQDVELSPSGYLLPEVSIDVEPTTRLVIDVKLTKASLDDAQGDSVALLQQVVKRDKPGTLEFVLDNQGRYKHRSKNERISRIKRIAYLIEDRYEIKPVEGMTPAECYDAQKDGGCHIQVFDVEPGASGSVIDRSTGDAVASWSESFSCLFEKKYLIGQAASGLDLYPCPLDQAPNNASLPTVTVVSTHPSTSLNGIKALLSVDGRRVSVSREVVCSEDDDTPSRLEFRLGDTLLPDTHVSECRLAIVQANVGERPIFTYRFAIAPIQKFRIASITREHGRQIATYEFSVPHCTVVEDETERQTVVGAFHSYSFRALLGDETVPLSLTTPGDGKRMDAVLGLAGAEITLPTAMRKLIDSGSPIGLPELLTLGRNASTITVSSKGWRASRGLYLSVFDRPVFYRELQAPGVHQISLLSALDLFLPSFGDREKYSTLGATIRYGYSSYGKDERFFLADCSLARTHTGYGTGCARIVVDCQGTRQIVFGAPTRCKLSAAFYQNGRQLEPAKSVEPGTTRLTLSRAVSDRLGTKRDTYLELAPVSAFGKARQDLSETILIER